MCLVYSIVYLEFVFSQHFADFQCLFNRYFSIFTLCSYRFYRPFLSVSGRLFVTVSLFFVLFAAPFVYLQFILVKVVFYFLEFQFEFLFVLAMCYCNQSMSIIFSCVHHFLISPVCQQQHSSQIKEKKNFLSKINKKNNVES